MNPLVSDWNFIPSSTAPASLATGPGVVVRVQTLHGQVC